MKLAGLQRVNQTVGARLDRLDAQFPRRREKLPFEEYLARASIRAQRDPVFAEQFGRAWQQYQAARGALKHEPKR